MKTLIEKSILLMVLFCITTIFSQNNQTDNVKSIKPLKIGAKLGRTFYFRVEAGYGFGDIPKEIEVTSSLTTETTTEEFPDIPGISDSGILIFNLGLGFSFL